MASVFKNMTYQGGVKGALDPFNLFHGKKKSSGGGGYEFRPYSGARPPQPEFLRPAEALTWDTIKKRSQGEDVGFDPRRMQLQTDLVKSELGKRQEDEMRSAKGAISSAGLSGNPRAYEALAGRVQRDIGRTLGDNLAKISIEDMTAANQEKRENTAYLNDFNKFNFGQSNKVADFDLDVYGAEEGNRARAYGINQDDYRYDTNRSDDQFSDLMGVGLAAGDLFIQSQTGIPGGATTASNALRSQGTGIAPNGANALATPSFYNQGIRKPRRNVYAF